MENAAYVKAAITAFFAALATLLGWKGVLAFVWLIAMLLDYVSGTFAAMKTGTWASKVARQGLWHKVGMVLAVLVAALADLGISVAMDQLDIGYTWSGWVMPLIMLWYTLTELGSVLENVVTMGAPVPDWLTKMLKISLKAVNNTGTSKTKEDDGE